MSRKRYSEQEKQLINLKVVKYLYKNASTFLVRKAICYSPYIEALCSKPRELLENPEEDNQQPSLGGDSSEGSTTSLNDLTEIMKDHERAASKPKSQSIFDPYWAATESNGKTRWYNRFGPFSGVDIQCEILKTDDDIV